MSNHLLVKLEDKIDDVIETLEILRLQIEELEEKNATLEGENGSLKNRQIHWEQSLAALLGKLEGSSENTAETIEITRVERFEREEVEA